MRNRWSSPQLRIWMHNPRVYVTDLENNCYFTDLYSISPSEVREVSLPIIEIPRSRSVLLLLENIQKHANLLADEGVAILLRGEPADYL